MGQWLSMTFCFLILFPSHSGVLEVEDSFEPHYVSCVNWGMNHPLKNQYTKETNSLFLDSLNDFCLCKRDVDREEQQQFQAKKLEYFFSGRDQYFSRLDVCIQEKVHISHFQFFFGMLAYDHLNPLVMNFIREDKAPNYSKIVGRDIARSWDDCLQNELLKSCHKVSSLYFTYKCIRKKARDREFLEEIKKFCREIPNFTQELI